MIYAYPSPFPCHNSRGDKDLFETALAKVFSSTSTTSALTITRDPSAASIFYVSACLVDHFFRVRNEKNSSRLLRAAEDAVLAQIRALGYGHKPHVVNALRCHTTRGRRDERNHIVGAYPRLWASPHRFARVCTEAVYAPDPTRSMHMPYCPPRSSSSSSSSSSISDAASDEAERRLLHRDRPTRVVFIGSHLMSRKRSLTALHRQANLSRKLIIINPFRRGGAPGMVWCDLWHPLNTDCPGQERSGITTTTSSSSTSSKSNKKPRRRQYNRGLGVNTSAVLALMLDSVYTFCPVGDAPDSPRVYTALSRGSIPLIEPEVSLPPLVDWASLSYRIEFDALTGALKLPSATQEASLRKGAAWAAANNVFACEASNPHFVRYVERSFAQIAAAAPAGGAARDRP